MNSNSLFLISSVFLLSISSSGFSDSDPKTLSFTEKELNETLDDEWQENKQENIPLDFPSILAQDNQKNSNGMSQESCSADIQPYQVNVRHLEWEGIGYKEGYTTLQGFLSHEWGKYVPFFDARGHVFNDGKFAANAGVGLRYIINPNKSMIGGNVYYDYRNTRHYHYNQIGAGLEGFYNRWELRVNGYLPLGSKTHLYNKGLINSTFKRFEGHYLLINEHYKVKQEFAMKGFNAEVGVHPLAMMRNYDLYVAAGPYYFAGKGNKHAWGGMVRAKASIVKYLSVEIGDSYDHLFHNRFHAEVAITVPLGGRKLRSIKKGSSVNSNSCFADNVMFYRASQPAERHEIIVVDKRKKNYTIDPIAIDPTTGQPFYFVFVNNTNTTAPSAQQGTFEDPYQSLSLAQAGSSPGNVIYVFAGDGTTTNMDMGITLQNTQRFLGSGCSHGFLTTKGAVVVPPQTSTLPNITGSSISGIVTVAVHDNEVSGFNISTNSNTVPGIGGPLELRGNVFITCNFIDVPTTSTAGTIAVGITDSPGIPTIVTIDGNQLIGGRIGTGIGNTTNISTGLRITNNTVSNSALVYSQTGATCIATSIVSGNEVHGNTSLTASPIAFQANNNSTYYVKILNNYVHDNTGSGISLDMQSPTQLGTIYAEVAGNIVTNNSVNGVLLQNDAAPGVLCARLVNNIASGNTTNQYFINNVAGGTLNLEPLINNVGAITFSGSVTFVPPCGCNVCP